MSDAIETTAVTEPIRLHLVPLTSSETGEVDESARQTSDKAGVAQLTLRLRAAQADAEAIEHQIEVAEETARRELRRRLDDLREQRRLVLDAEVARVEAEVAASIEAAREHARELSGTERSDVELVDNRAILGHGATLQISSTTVDGLRSEAIIVDVDTLARVCAMVVAEVLDQRYGGQLPVSTPSYALPVGYVAMPAAAASEAAARKKGFLRNLMSGDVVLIGLAAAIVAVVLVAWLG
jgi:hypothetical protein